MRLLWPGDCRGRTGPAPVPSGHRRIRRLRQLAGHLEPHSRSRRPRPGCQDLVASCAFWEAAGFGVERYGDDCVTRTQGGIDVEDRTRRAVLYQRWRSALRDRPAGGGLKPPQAASVKSRGGERCGHGATRARQVRAEKASESEPLMTCRKRIDDIETGRESFSRDEPGGDLLTAQAVSGIKAARAQLRLWCGTCEPVAPTPSAVHWTTTVPQPQEGGPQAGATARGRVPTWGTGTDRLVVAMMPGNAGGAKGAGHPGWFGGQP